MNLHNAENGNYADAEGATENLSAKAEVYRIVQRSKDIYTIYQSSTPLLLAFCPILYLTLSLVVVGIWVIMFNSWKTPYDLIFSTLMFQPACIQAYTMSLIYLEQTAVRVWPRKIIKFMLFGGFSTLSVFSMILPFQIKFCGIGMAGMLGVHAIISLLWASFPCRS